ncbi:MAG: hypothetical protein AAFO94_04810 [Bacteroidota bacterium]
MKRVKAWMRLRKWRAIRKIKAPLAILKDFEIDEFDHHPIYGLPDGFSK